MYMAEMRTVTTLFVKLDSYCPEKHKNLLSLQVTIRSKFCFHARCHLYFEDYCCFFLEIGGTFPQQTLL